MADSFPKKYYFDYITWLSMITGYVSVWTEFTMGTLNDSQRNALRKLKEAGLYRGTVK